VDDLMKALKRLHRAMRILTLALVFMLTSVIARMFNFPEVLCVWGMGSTIIIFIVIVIHRDALSRFCRWAWPFVLKKTAIKIIREEKEISKTQERERITFMKYDELFQDLPAYEFSRDSQVEISGIALISPHGHPMSIKKFQYARCVIEDDQVHITI